MLFGEWAAWVFDLMPALFIYSGDVYFIFLFFK